MHCLSQGQTRNFIRVEEDEEPIHPSIGRGCVAEPWRLFSVNSLRIGKRVREEFGIGEKGLVCLGGFENVRAVYDWNGLKLELDETHYDFGTSYELECESLEPEKTKKLLEELLKEMGLLVLIQRFQSLPFFDQGSFPISSSKYLQFKKKKRLFLFPIHVRCLVDD